MSTHQVTVRRIYDEPAAGDGARVLVDGIWPRGVSKERADLATWCRAVAPSKELRRWYDHDPERFDEFARRYRDELEDDERAAALDELRSLLHEGDLTLLTASRRDDISQAAVLERVLREG